MTSIIPVLDKELQVISQYDVGSLLDIEPDHRILSEVVRWQLANRRPVTQNVKNRSMVSGAHRKLFRQKGTGKARQGDGKACHFRGGGACFKIIDRNHTFKLNKKLKQVALRMMLSDRKNHLCLLNNMADLDLNKTKDFSQFLHSMFAKINTAKKVVFMVAQDEYQNALNKLRGSKNLYNVSIVPVTNFNVLSSVEAILVTDVKAIKTLQERLS